MKDCFIWIGLTLSLILNIWGISKWAGKADDAHLHDAPRNLRLVVNAAPPETTAATAPSSDLSRSNSIKRPKDGHVWSDPVVLTNFLHLSSSGTCRIEPDLTGLLGLDKSQSESLQLLLPKAVESVVTQEKASAKLTVTENESFVEIPRLARDPVGTLIGEVNPPLNPDQRSLLESVLRASAWFRDLTQPRVLSLEESADGSLYFHWYGARHRINGEDESSDHGPWAGFSDRFHHLVDFKSLVTAPETRK